MFKYVPMNSEYADEIAYKWKYEGRYSFYDMTEDDEDLEEFLDPKNWTGNIYAVLDEQEQLIGFFQYSINHLQLEIGLGLKPELTGRGIGEEFVLSGIKFGAENFKHKISGIALSVASFNKRAIKVYKKLGFEKVKTELIHTNGGEYEFLRMEKAQE